MARGSRRRTATAQAVAQPMVPGALTSPAEIDFIMAGGSACGLGHIMRCAALASAADQRGWKLRAYIDGDRTARERWTVASGQTDIAPWPRWQAKDAARLTFVDYPGDKEAWLSRLRRSGTRVVVLDDPRYCDQADLTVCPALHHISSPTSEARTTPIENPDSRMLFGPRFAILSEIHRTTPQCPLQTRTKLLLSMGGADPHRMTPRIAPVLESVLDNSEVLHGITTRHVVLGPAFDDPGDAIARTLADTGWQVHRSLDGADMARLMSESKLAVMGFGTSLTELAWHGTPHLSITHHRSDDVLARTLESTGIGVHLGYAGALDLAVVESRFRRALEDEAWQRASARTADHAIEGGLGVERILERIENWLRPGSPSKSARIPTKGNHVSPI